MTRSIRVLAEGVVKNVSGLRVSISDAWKDISSVRVYKNGAWKDVFPPSTPLPPPAPPAPPTPPPPAPPTLSVVCNPIQTSVTGPTNPLTTDGVLVVISGGTAPYTQAWECASWSGSVGAPVANSPTSTATTFTAPNIPLNSELDATFRVTVQDNTGSIAVGQVDVVFLRIKDSGA